MSTKRVSTRAILIGIAACIVVRVYATTGFRGSNYRDITILIEAIVLAVPLLILTLFIFVGLKRKTHFRAATACTFLITLLTLSFFASGINDDDGSTSVIYFGNYHDRSSGYSKFMYHTFWSASIVRMVLIVGFIVYVGFVVFNKKNSNFESSPQEPVAPVPFGFSHPLVAWAGMLVSWIVSVVVVRFSALNERYLPAQYILLFFIAITFFAAIGAAKQGRRIVIWLAYPLLAVLLFFSVTNVTVEETSYDRSYLDTGYTFNGTFYPQMLETYTYSTKYLFLDKTSTRDNSEILELSEKFELDEAHTSPKDFEKKLKTSGIDKIALPSTYRSHTPMPSIVAFTRDYGYSLRIIVSILLFGSFLVTLGRKKMTVVKDGDLSTSSR